MLSELPGVQHKWQNPCIILTLCSIGMIFRKIFGQLLFCQKTKLNIGTSVSQLQF